MNTAKQIGVLIKSCRKKKKLSQNQLSVKVFGNDTHQATISNLESGKHDNVRFDTVYNVLESLGIDLLSIIKNKI